jgi:hypothetical protein
MLKYFKSLSVIESGASGLQMVGQIIWLLLVGGSASLTGWLAKNAPIIAKFGPLAWIGAGLFAGLFVAVILAIMKWSTRQERYGEYLIAMAQKSSSIDPMSEAFDKKVIKIPDLAIPGKMLHDQKHFKGCFFIGPGAIAIIGGQLTHSKFDECGDVIALSEPTIYGVSVLQNCTITNCHFIRVTILADQITAQAMKQGGFPVTGLTP